VYIGFYGLIQVFLSQIPNFGELWWLSYVAAIMTFTYSFLGLGLGISRAKGEQRIISSFLFLVGWYYFATPCSCEM
jgi:hypothetical protein